jgi:hypothetical protein
MALIEINWHPSPRELRQFAGFWLPAFFGVAGSLIGYHSGSWTLPVILWSAALAVGSVGLVRPSFIRPVYTSWMWASLPVGWTVSHLMLAAVFFLVLTPIGLVARMFGYDPMKSTFDRSAKTYWVPHNPGEEAGRYFRQF